MARGERVRDACACGASWHAPLDDVLPTAARRVRERVEALQGGEGGVVVVRGDHDAGTDWFVAAARDAHPAPARVGRSSPARRRVPLWPLWEIVAGDGTEPLPRPGVDAVNRVVAEIVALADAGPTLVAIEELEHADPWTLAGLEVLAEAARERPLLVVVTVASTGLSPADELVDRLLERDLARCVDIGPLDRPTLARLVRSVLDTDEAPDELVSFVADRAGGLAGLAARIVRLAVRQGLVVATGTRWSVAADLARAVPGDAVSSVVRALAATTTVERDLLTAAAVLGGSTSPRVLADAVGCDLDEAADALARSSRRGLLRLRVPTVALRTGIVRDEVLRTLTLRTSLETLDHIADASARLGDAAGFERVVDVLIAAGHESGIVGHRLRMARRAIDDGDLTTARRQCGAVPPSAERSRLEAEIAAAAGAPRDDVAAPDGDEDRVALTRATALRDVREAVDLVGDDDGPWRTVLDALSLPIEARVDALEHGLDDLGPATMLALRHLAALALPTDETAAASLLRRAGAVADSSGDALERRRVDAATAQIDLARTGAPHRLAAIATTLLQRGDRVVGAAFAADAAVALVWSGDPIRGSQLATAAVEAAVDRAPDTARRALAAVGAATAMTAGDAPGSPPTLGAAAFFALVNDDLDAAIDAIDQEVVEFDPAFASVASTQWAWLARVPPLLQRLAGDPPGATTDRWRWSANVAAWDDLARAAELGAAGDVVGAQTAFTNADALLARSATTRLLARRLAGELAVRDGWAGPPVERALRAALAESVQRDLTALASRCRCILRSGGLAVPRFGEGDDDVPVDLRATGVTARELEIVRLLHAGATTAEVAEQLYVSVATVKSHVTHVMRKLGYRSRRELLAGVEARQT
jgi:DNA-binding CsgD family transcriptional regulator